MPESKESAGTASGARTFLTAALLTYACGTLVLVGFNFLYGGVGGIFVGLIVASFAVVVWRGRQGSIFPRNPSTKSVVMLALLGAVATFVAVGLTA